MKKKRLYEKPSTEVVMLQQQSTLLAGSNGTGGLNPMGEPGNLSRELELEDYSNYEFLQ